MVSCSCCALAFRSAASHLEKVIPVASRKRRAKALRLIRANLTRSSSDSGGDKWSRAHSKIPGKRFSLGSEGTGYSMYCACPPWRCGGATSNHVTRLRDCHSSLLCCERNARYQRRPASRRVNADVLLSVLSVFYEALRPRATWQKCNVPIPSPRRLNPAISLALWIAFQCESAFLC